MADHGDLLARLTTAVARTAGGSLSSRLCQAYRDLAGATGAAITVRYGTPERVTLAATDESSARLEDLQDVIGEGPGHSAWRTGQVEIGTLPSPGASLWDLFVEAAEDVVESAAIHAVPILPGRNVFGVVTLYQVPRTDQPLRLERAELQFLANAIGAGLLRDASAFDEEGGGPWASRARIHQATGMVVAQLGISPQDALALLRAHAYVHESTLSDIAASVVERRLTFPIP